MSQAGTGIVVDRNQRGVQHLTIDVRKFFTAVGKATLKLATGAYSDAASELPELASAFGLAAQPEDRAVALVIGGIERSLASLTAAFVTSERLDASAIHAASFTGLSNSFSITIDSNFYDRPWSSSAVSAVGNEAKRWLEIVGLTPTEASNVVSRLPSVLARSLHDEWRSNSAFYSELLNATDSPFLNAANFEESWQQYRVGLIALQSEQVFDESFSLSQIYVEPRCYHLARLKLQADTAKFGDSREQCSEPVRVAKYLSEEIDRWLASPDRDLATRIIAGGPGAGKSSYAKMLSSRLAQEGRNVLLVPLHQIDLETGVSSSINKFFIESGHFQSGPLDRLSESKLTVLILDGLDEIQMQGRAAAESAYDMVNDLLKWIDRINSTSLKIKCIVTGRELAVQSAEGLFRLEGQVIHLLPYHVPHNEVREYFDPDNILSKDQRDEWWRRYGDLSDNDFTGIPPTLKDGEIGEVTAQPLLNYLVALAYQRGLEINEETNVNLVYQDLLHAVFNRSWAKNSHPSIRDIPYDSFVRLLEEVALAVWHGAGRTTTLAEVEDHCKRSKVGPLLSAIERTASSGVSSLLLSFYFRQKGRRSSGDKTFEFTHKTFAEYLTALAVVRLIETISKQLSAFDEDSDTGFEDETALHKWLTLCDAASFDKYLNDFVRREVDSRSIEVASVWQRTLSRMLSYSLRHGWPIHRFDGIKLGEQSKRLRNSEEALLASLNACSRATKTRSNIRWDNDTSFGLMVKRLQGQRSGPANVLAMNCLSYLNIDEQCIDISDFFNADLSFSSMRYIQANYATFLRADLTDCDLSFSTINGCNLSSAKLNGCKVSANQVIELRRKGSGRRIVDGTTTDDAQEIHQIILRSMGSMSHRGVIFIDEDGETISESEFDRFAGDQIKKMTRLGRHLLSEEATEDV